uniref:Aromatic-L-amino-acid decarboxylase n=1 Tax=Megaselia scalaris TaxID=36166 RepID=T1GSD2_MEGSC
MPGMVHWNHPKFFAYFSSGNSYPSVLGDLLSSALAPICFSWASCPASTELETIVLNWYGKALGLPEGFLSDAPGSIGGGAYKDQLQNLIAYSSKEAHSSIEKAAKMALVKLKIIDTDSQGRMRVDLLKAAIEKDIESGLTPFYVVATVGTTGAASFDNLTEIGKVCQEVPSIWFHVDGAYGGNSFILPEMRKFSEGLEYADSFNCNPNKLLLTTFDASAMWVKNVMTLKKALTVNPLYLQHEHDKAIDYRHYGIPLSRRFRALKLWFVFRSYGIKGLQSYIRNLMALAKKFEMLVKKDERFEVCNEVYLGLVCFRLR